VILDDVAGELLEVALETGRPLRQLAEEAVARSRDLDFDDLTSTT
jgi:hypothetical protein